MAIIYSYPRITSLNGDELLVCSTRVEHNGTYKIINKSISIDDINDFATPPTLNEVLIEGNESISDIKIGDLYLYDNFIPQGYLRISGLKNRVSFYGKNEALFGYIKQDSLFLNDDSSVYGFSISKPETITTNRTATFQDKSGVVAYLSDIPTVQETTNYGLYSQTTTSSVVTGTTERSLIDSGEGTLSVPANGFKVGDSFRATMSGVMSAANNQTIRIRVKVGSIVLLDSGVQTLTNSIIDDIWDLNIDFTVRNIGSAGTASLVALGSFRYTKTSNVTVQGFAFNKINDNTFDTTINNELDITVEWGSSNAANKIYSNIFILNKTY